MKTKTILTAFLATLIALSQSAASPADDGKMAAANNIFAFKLLKRIAKEQPEQNTFISPYSASTALQMVANGAAGITKTEMDQVLGTGVASTGLSATGANEANKDIEILLSNGNTNVILEIANSIWYHRTAKVKPEFLACNQQYFGATVSPLDFANPQSVDIINNWASEKKRTDELPKSPMGSLIRFTAGCSWPVRFISKANGSTLSVLAIHKTARSICETAARKPFA